MVDYAINYYSLEQLLELQSRIKERIRELSPYLDDVEKNIVETANKHGCAASFYCRDIQGFYRRMVKLIYTVINRDEAKRENWAQPLIILADKQGGWYDVMHWFDHEPGFDMGNIEYDVSDFEISGDGRSFTAGGFQDVYLYYSMNQKLPPPGNFFEAIQFPRGDALELYVESGKVCICKEEHEADPDDEVLCLVDQWNGADFAILQDG